MKSHSLFLPFLFVGTICFFMVSCEPKAPNTVYTDNQRLMLDTTDNHTTNIDSLQKFVIKYQTIGDKQREMAAYAELGHAYTTASKYKDALDSHQKELFIAEELKDSLMLASCLNDLGTNYRRLSMYYEALESHSRAVEVAKTNSSYNREKLLKCQAVGNNGLGNIYLKLGNYVRADSSLRRALSIEKKLGSHLGMNVDYSNLGSVFEKRGMLDSAMVYFQKAYTHSKLCDSRTGVAYCHLNFGRIYKQKKEYEQAAQEFEIAMNTINKDIDKWMWLQPCIAYADIQIILGNRVQAEKYLNLAYENIQDLGNTEYYPQVYNLYSAYYAKLGNTSEALRYSQLSQAFTDSILSKQNLLEIENLRDEIIRRRNERLVGEANIQIEHERMLKWIYLLAFLLATTLLGIFIYFLRQRSKKYKELEEKYQLAAQQVKDTQKALTKEEKDLISRFTNRIYDQMRESDINIDELALELCMSKSTLRRRITEITGDSLTNYINKIRVDYAKQLLKKNPELSINDIGTRCGFCDQAYFSRIFKQATEVSPAQYRKNISN